MVHLLLKCPEVLTKNDDIKVNDNKWNETTEETLLGIDFGCTVWTFIEQQNAKQSSLQYFQHLVVLFSNSKSIVNDNKLLL